MRSETYIYYNQKFWLGFFTEEDSSGEIIRVGRYIFGKETTLAELDEWMAKGFTELVLHSASKKKLSLSKRVLKKNLKEFFEKLEN